MSIDLQRRISVTTNPTFWDLFIASLLLVEGEVEQLRQAGKDLPPASTRPMREAVPA